MDRRTFLHMAIAVPAFNATAGEFTQRRWNELSP